MNKVFCGECKWYWRNVKEYLVCGHPNNVEKRMDYMEEYPACVKKPCERNTNNDCPDFEPKLWTKIMRFIKGLMGWAI